MIKYQQLDLILQELFSAQDFLSGEKLAHSLGISRSAIHKKITKLREQGYIVIAESNRGFCLQEPYPFEIVPEFVAQYSQNKQIETIFFEEVSSTNTIAKELALQKSHPFLIFARTQTSGRGRMNRTWEMQSDKDIVMSLTLPCHLSQSHLFAMIRLSALSVYKVLSQYTDQLLIKWPNDIVTVDGQKICGILTESVLEDNSICSIVIGMGVNINSSNLPEYACSLSDLTKKNHNINKIIAEICDKIALFWENFPQNENEIITEWEQNLAWQGEKVCLSVNDEEYCGIFEGLDVDGALCLNIKGQKKVFLTGDLSGIKLRRKS